jgi:hypothetical protein
MRSFFALLLLGNLLLAGVHALRPATPAAPQTRAPSVPSIELVGESPRDARRSAAGAAPAWADKSPAWESRNPASAREPRLGAQPSSTEPVTAVPPASCISVGPFRDAAGAERAAATLVAAGHSPSTRSAEEDFWLGYWVYIENLASATEANAAAAEMREGGIADAYVVSDDELGTLVSLGVFSEAPRADRHSERARALGREPTVVGRSRRATASWLDIAVSGESSIDLQTLQPPDSATALRLEPCGDRAAP